MRKKIAAQIKKFEEKGIPYTTQELAQICDLPIEAIKNTLTTAGAVTVEYIPTITEASMTEFKKSPEELTIEKEREEAFSKIIENACPKRDVQIFFAFHGINRPSMNFKEISEATGIASGEIRRIIQRTGRKLRGSLEMAQMASEYGRSERIRNMEEIHFIDDEEIDELIDEYSVI